MNPAQGGDCDGMLLAHCSRGARSGIPRPMHDDGRVRAQPLARIVGITQLTSSPCDFHVEHGAWLGAIVVLERADAGDSATDSPGAKNLLGFVGAREPTIADSDDLSPVPRSKLDPARVDPPGKQLTAADNAAQSIDGVEKQLHTVSLFSLGCRPCPKPTLGHKRAERLLGRTFLVNAL